ncbi:hypothetical protein [Serratia marcescens]|uniref:hypothetical protein n=1 Tax=Serratia marcescens TaxID=615 RepID=UPI0011163180|nr:hypothetical protein [Serratia marcescens]
MLDSVVTAIVQFRPPLPCWSVFSKASVCAMRRLIFSVLAAEVHSLKFIQLRQQLVDFPLALFKLFQQGKV